MNKSIVCLLIAGIVLAMLHVPATMVHLAVITGLLLMTVKVLWGVLQRFSTPHRDLTAR
ncbi:MAG: hypothetical protein AAF703_07360 [Cyanobacteria bacterium P01_D01_bin.105]